MFSRILNVHKGPFKYYVIKIVGGWVWPNTYVCLHGGWVWQDAYVIKKLLKKIFSEKYFWNDFLIFVFKMPVQNTFSKSFAFSIFLCSMPSCFKMVFSKWYEKMWQKYGVGGFSKILKFGKTLNGFSNFLALSEYMNFKMIDIWCQCKKKVSMTICSGSGMNEYLLRLSFSLLLLIESRHMRHTLCIHTSIFLPSPKPRP